MITFIVTGDFILNAKYLDDQRLAKQRVECVQILNAIANGGGWSNHPITKAWVGYEKALKYYTNCIINEFILRGGNNNIPFYEVKGPILYPWWTQWDRLHYSHQAVLIRKNPFHYKFVISDEYKSYGYIWPKTYEERDLPLNVIAAPINKDLVDPKYCMVLLKSGVRKGQPCQRLIHIKNGIKNDTCNIHL